MITVLTAPTRVARVARRSRTQRRVAVVTLAVAMIGAAARGETRHSGWTPLAEQPPVVLVGPNTAPAEVLFPAEPHPLEKQAAEQLAHYLSEITGAAFAAREATAPLPDRAVFVGRHDDSLLADLTREGFLIRTSGQQLRLVGGSPRATLYAVFDLLEEQLGCRWWSHSEEHLPHQSALQVPAQNTHLEPAFRVHDLFNKEGQSPRNFFVYKRRGASGVQYTAVHNLCPMLKPHAERRPEFLPMNQEGRREFNNIHMNYTAPGMAELVAEKLGEEVLRRKGNTDDFFYFAGMGDWYGGMDQSPESQKIYDDETWIDPDGRKKPGYVATMLQMVNRAAELLEQKHPGATVATHAYMSLEAPPAKTRPRSNVIVEIPRLRHDTVRSIVESEKNQSFRRNLERWCELAPGRVYIWEYGVNFNNFLKPFPCLKSIAANIKHYHRAGVAGIRIQGNYVSTGGDLVVLKNYVWGKLLWDPTRSVDDLIREFCEGYYGPAAAAMIAYVELLEGAVRGDTPVAADEFHKRFEDWLRPDVVREAEALLETALVQAGDDNGQPWRRRVLEARASLEAFHLWNPGELREEGEQLVRADFPDDTLPRVRDLLAHCRGASPREWGDGRAYHLELLSLHGGPLPTLRGGQLTVKVAPLLAGQVRSVLLGEAVAIDESRDLLDPAARIYEITRRAGNRVEMEAELGIEHWGSNTKQLAQRTVEVTAEGLLRVTGSVQSVAGGRSTRNRPRVVTTYLCDGDPESVAVRYRDQEGRWIDVAPARDSTPAKIPRAEELNIQRPDRGLQIHDRYLGLPGATATVERLPAAKGQAAAVRITVLLGEVATRAEQPTAYSEREIRVTKLP